MSRSSRIAVLWFTVTLVASTAHAQSFEVGVNFVASQWSEFEGTDLGIGGRLTWKPTSAIGVDADLAWYPGEYPPDSIPFSDGRFEGLFGMTFGPRLNRVRPFAKVAAGFLHTTGAQERIICLAIFPPPLNCLMAEDRTLPAFEFGGGVEISVSDRSLVRVDVSDRMLEYPGPTFRDRFERVDEAFFGHALRLTIGFAYAFK